MIIHTHTRPRIPQPRQQHAPAVVLREVSRTYGDPANPVHALRDVSVDLYRQEFTAIMGPSGSGKSTLMNVIAGLDEITAGQILLAGEPVGTLDDTGRTLLRRKHIGFIFQSFNLIPTLTANENIKLPFILSGNPITPEQQAWIAHLIGVLGLRERLDHRPAELSGGQQQRVAIVRALANRPSIILADEPTGALDTRTAREVLALLTTAAHEYGQGIAMVTHDPVAASYADRILMLADGRIVGEYRGLDPRQISEIIIGLQEARR
ncbi:ABC transporter ATP-binding protein [Gordonia sp. (in: high G+C Gram-positive bacteria)]|jgi:putative ABC transport system ATP-binding protein|uniref:ABC transporter ATP-binding protein n=1 Tax=Gordonia sp. (in: high G+C Gram-positive bacteria) TaxID=84139 RepID=UPI001DA280D1|nr:ABC transporter ATP-binding protein [Gordonia sp. (in: high G+C Gram-positive bacteria)]MCB1295347.1 ABC transporter ATP-binding protein [Gordonia sp. (in: high G+C Gram-positive bacteria)]HMS74949.1 ABC transporter ATP-binding protein [Gordonia sp. (in: high G+C Gram-positive bacteria)]